MAEQNLPTKWATERAHPRLPFDGAVSVITPEPDRTLLRGRCVDISMSGMSARIPADLSVGVIVQIEFKLPSVRDPFQLRAIVRNRLITRYGFEFLAPNPEQLTQLHRFCETLKILQ